MESFLLITNQRSILSEILEPYQKKEGHMNEVSLHS